MSVHLHVIAPGFFAIRGGAPIRQAMPLRISERSPDGMQWNPGSMRAEVPDSGARRLHPGYWLDA
ncbi:hypothetical protein [Solimonas aquatica]|uniref:hypothetical protein n=1 Tax=Solimonas aquatica TaxID=489703 RepID=UPI000B83895A|nr:hypothetical protein [Solimonas aquatica]